jgi:predicted SnoaL-like aldol condensation-catalyzing enzyme
MQKQYLSLFILALILSLAACQKNPINEKEAKYKAIATKMDAIFDNGNVDELDAIIAENAVDHQMDTSMTKQTGLAGVKETFSKFHKIFPDMKTTIHSIAVSGDTVFVYSTSVGTTSEPFMGMPANNKSTISGIDVVRFEGDKMVEHWGFIDMNDMMKMMQSQMPSDMPMTGKKKK